MFVHLLHGLAMTKLTLLTDFCCKAIQFTKNVGKTTNFAV